MLVVMVCFGGRITRIADRKYRTESFFSLWLTPSVAPRRKTYTSNFSNANGHPHIVETTLVYTREWMWKWKICISDKTELCRFMHTHTMFSGVFIKKNQWRIFMSRQKLKLWTASVVAVFFFICVATAILLPCLKCMFFAPVFVKWSFSAIEKLFLILLNAIETVTKSNSNVFFSFSSPSSLRSMSMVVMAIEIECAQII